MCTVTFVPVENGVLLTSNRDEWHSRSTAISPGIHTDGKHVLLYPMDKDGGGSWIATSNKGDAAVLLNGAFRRHARSGPYRKSRGMVLLEVMNGAEPLVQLERSVLQGIEPFTLVLYTGGMLYEFRWDGSKKFLARLSDKTPHIWSSVTLYDQTAAKQRKEWFYQWQESIINPGINEIIQFHRTAGTGDPANALLMKREDNIATVSITSIYLSRVRTEMRYHDIRDNREYTAALPLLTKRSPVSRRSVFSLQSEGIKRWWIRWRYWEYWPFDLLYLPVYVYWMWLSLKARSFFFFSAANPLIRNAGFLLEKKKDIYDLIPQGCYPATVFCRMGTSLKDLRVLLTDKKLQYPLIAKPDIGQRGMLVKLIRSDEELRDYLHSSRVDFLVQEFISYQNEAGIFYYRIPGERSGYISGIVGKEFLTVTGDGHSTIEQLLLTEKRHLLQLPALRKTHGELLGAILPAGEERQLVPYGNHSRGAKFIDLTHLATPALVDAIDRVCQAIPEFYYGRLDVKFSSWEELCRGINFSIIELNGAGSEPTHIYDPRHSVFFAWKEIIRHLRLLSRISLANKKTQGLRLMSTREGLLMLRENRKYLKMLEGD